MCPPTCSKLLTALRIRGPQQVWLLKSVLCCRWTQDLTAFSFVVVVTNRDISSQFSQSWREESRAVEAFCYLEKW